MGTISESLLDQYRSINLDDGDWYGHVIAQHVRKIQEFGIDVDQKDVQFSGFWSQGDGASWAGKVNLNRFMQHFVLVDKYPMVWKFMTELGWGDHIGCYVSRHASRYSHSNTVSAHIQTDIPNEYVEEFDELRYSVMELHLEILEKQCDELQGEVDIICKGLMDELYGELEEEHDYQTSDEQVRATLEANEIFDEEDDEDESEDAPDEDDVALHADHRPEVQVHAVA
jgi:hypothetical protein